MIIVTNEGKNILSLYYEKHNITFFSCKKQTKNITFLNTLTQYRTSRCCFDHFYQLFTIYGIKNTIVYACSVLSFNEQRYTNSYIFMFLNISKHF